MWAQSDTVKIPKSVFINISPKKAVIGKKYTINVTIIRVVWWVDYKLDKSGWAL